MLDDKAVLVTGGTGSLGKALVRRILAGEFGKPSRLVVFSRDEAKQHEMRTAYLNRESQTDEIIYENSRHLLQFRIGDVRDFSAVASALAGIDVVINAAALKQVPVCEYFPSEALSTNCLGPENIVRAIENLRLPVETVVGVSTDKACKPVNVMGMTKSLQERIFISANMSLHDTRLICVRYGNVMASRGSVVPLFHKQIRGESPVTITDERMTRFMLSIDQAVDLIFSAIADCERGEILVPRAPASSVVTVAKALIGDRDKDIVFTGIRPGEKLHEIMISEEEVVRVHAKGNNFAIRSMLPELGNDSGETADLDGEFSSATNLLGVEDTRKLLERNGLLVEQNPDFKEAFFG